MKLQKNVLELIVSEKNVAREQKAKRCTTKRAYILILIINYNFKKKGLIVKGALSKWVTQQLLHNLVHV